MMALKDNPFELCVEDSCEGRAGKVSWCQVVKPVNIFLRKCGSYGVHNREHQKEFEQGSKDNQAVLFMRLA